VELEEGCLGIGSIEKNIPLKVEIAFAGPVTD
jgi:hypothetical protein